MTGVFGAAVVLIDIGRGRRDELATLSDRSDLDDVVDDLAQVLHAQWQQEADHQRIFDPVPLPVQWRRPPDDLLDSWANISRSQAPGHRPVKRRRKLSVGMMVNPLPDSGDADRILEFYRLIPSGRMIVLGGPGSGKTIVIMRLGLGLIDGRAHGEPAPVIFSLGAWDPGVVTMWDWLESQLIRDHPWLAAPSRSGTLAAALVGTGRILPILDGFDEIAEGLQSDALQAMNGVSIPLVLTSRIGELGTAVAATDVVTAAAGIELQPVSAVALADYLRRTTARGAKDGLWESVLQQIEQRPRGAAAQRLVEALSSPLMVSLARTIYGDTPGSDPNELLDGDRFPTAPNLETHLLHGFVVAAYTQTARDQRPVRRRGATWPADRALRWLAYLAAHLRHSRTSDLAWWQLSDTVPRLYRFAAYSLVGGLAGSLIAASSAPFIFGREEIVFITAVGWTSGAYELAIFGGALSKGVPPTFVLLRLRGRVRYAVGAFWRRFLAIMVTGLVPAVVLGWLLPWGMTWALALGFLVTPAVALSVSIAGALETPVDIRKAASPGSVLRQHRTTAVLQAIVAAVTMAAVMGLAASKLLGRASLGHIEASGSARAAIAIAVIAGLNQGIFFLLAIGAWGRWFIVVRCWLPLRRRLPWRVNRFISDAYRRGVLRQSGAVYQFRHARLQHYLSDGHR